MIDQLLIAFAVSAATAVAVTPLVIRLARYIGAVDLPSERKIHTQPIPRLGGLAIYVAFFLTAVVFFLTRKDSVSPPWGGSLQGFALVVTSLLVLLLGVWDDVKQLGPGRKFLLQVALSSIVYFAGIRITIVGQPLAGGLLDLGWLSYPATILWIVGIMNALNLIDGLDGLASGIAMVAALTIGAVSFVKFDDYGTALVAVILAGSLFGFLRYNFNPARIFLGDSGSLFLGFVLAILSIIGATKGSAAFAIFVPALSLGLPILDTGLSMARRLMRPAGSREATKDPAPRRIRSMFLPDRNHIHHRLLALGLSQREAVILLYFVSSALGCSAFGLTVADKVGGVLILAVAGMAMVAGIHRLRYNEFAILRRGVLLPLYNRPIVQKPVFQAIVDAAFTLIAFGLAYMIAHEEGLPDLGREDFRLLLGVTALQMLVFVLSGVYKGVLRHAGIEDAVRIMKSVGLSLAIGVGLYLAFGFHMSDAATKTFLFDFYFLLTLLVFSRFSFAFLNRAVRYNPEGRDPVVIYGTGERAVAALWTILASPELRLRPIGFLDEDHRLEGKMVHGYPVLGGHWRLERLIRFPGVKALVIATDTMIPEVQRRIRRTARNSRLAIKVFSGAFADLPPAEVEIMQQFTPFTAQSVEVVGIPAVDFPRRNS